MRTFLGIVAMFAFPAFAVGFQYLSIPDDAGRSIEIGTLGQLAVGFL